MSGTEITTGTRVMFSRAFLQSTAQYTGWAPFARGKVISTSMQTADVLWDGPPKITTVHMGNLVREDRIHLEPQ